MSTGVALVLDPNFGGQIRALAQRMPVWIITSAANDTAVGSLRSEYKEGHLTLLLTLPGEKTTDTLSRALLAIDEHHGDESQACPYHVVEVYGVNSIPDSALSSELGFKKVQQTGYGFRAEK